STSFHDALYVRRVLGKRPAPEFQQWLQMQGIMTQTGHRLSVASTHPLLSYR
ncbi:MAG: ethanolamine ammonia-lyase subunit EutB, partial [Chitinophagaceae bacterium]|nr:ethanolamine ammonia-lyase subunit EutB [Chitinophagaceae bacterium]